MNILFIGNSYTFYNDMPKIFEQLAIRNGKDVTVHSVTKGSRKLCHYIDDQDPITITLDTLLSEQKFDICFIQENSVLPAIDFDEFIRGLDCVVNKLKGRAERLLLYVTWGRKSGSKKLIEHNWTTESMAGLISEAYHKAADLYGAGLSPVGSRFLYITQNHPEINLYNDDLTHPSYPGSCLAALTHYHTLFGELPEHTDTLALSDDEISSFKEAFAQ